MLLCCKSEQQVFLIVSCRCYERIHTVEVFFLQKVDIRTFTVEHHNVVQVCGKVPAAVQIVLDDLYRAAELIQLLRKIESGLSSADYHNVIQADLFILFVYLLMQL